MKTYRTTIEIDDVEVNIEIGFKAEFSEVEIEVIRDLETGLEISEWDIDNHVLDSIYEQLHDFVANQYEVIETENFYVNVQ